MCITISEALVTRAARSCEIKAFGFSVWKLIHLIKFKENPKSRCRQALKVGVSLCGAFRPDLALKAGPPGDCNVLPRGPDLIFAAG